MSSDVEIIMFRMDYSRSQTPVLPKNVEDGVNKFRVGEDFALAHRLQGQHLFQITGFDSIFQNENMKIIRDIITSSDILCNQIFD